MPIDAAERDRQRLGFMEQLYEQTNGSDLATVHVDEIARGAGIDPSTARGVARYLAGEDLVSNGSGWHVTITHAGIVEVEQSRREPQQRTEHFPPLASVNFINIGAMTNSNIQQGTARSSQHVTFTTGDMKTVNDWLDEVSSALPQLPLDGDQRLDARASLDTLKAQLGARKPSAAILAEAGRTLRALLEGAVASGAASALLAHWPAILAAMSP